MSCEIQPDASQHVGKLFSGEHPATAFVRISKTHAETLDLYQALFVEGLQVNVCLIEIKRSAYGDCTDDIVAEARQHSCGRRETSQAPCGRSSYTWCKNVR